MVGMCKCRYESRQNVLNVGGLYFFAERVKVPFIRLLNDLHQGPNGVFYLAPVFVLNYTQGIPSVRKLLNQSV